ncbi:T9SS type A sorting domain-containing protein [bacterium AH-315-C07]|nr:T9SS type A sorting domain-containing protein [bacterium AH-315-C07]
MTAPSDGATNLDVNERIDWGSSAGATSYEFKISSVDSTLSSTTSQAATNTYYDNSELKFGTTYYWQVRAISVTDSSTWSSIRNFITGDILTHTSPSDGATGLDVSFTINWSYILGNSGYRYQVDTSSGFNSPILLDKYKTSSSQDILYDLRFGTKYFWRVKSHHATDTSLWSIPTSFTTEDMLNNITPADGAVNQAVSLTLDWDYISGATDYHYQLDTSSNFNSPLFYEQFFQGSSQNTVSGLMFGTTYYWRVRVSDAVDTSAWSTITSFVTDDKLSNISPSNGATNQTIDVQLDWDYITGTTGYYYQIDTTTGFNSPLLVYSQDAPPSDATMSELLFNTTYYWRVLCYHSTDTSGWSDPTSFTTTAKLSNTSPSNGSAGNYPDVTIDWSYGSGMSAYQYELDTSAGFNSPLYQLATRSISSSSQQLSALRFGTIYYWRARGVHAKDTMDWSDTWSFTTIDTLNHTSPSNGSSYSYPSMNIDWSYCSGITNYDYEQDTSANFNSTYYSRTTVSSASSQAALTELDFGATYYWRARAMHAVDTMPFSKPWSFTVYPATSHVSPADGSSNVSLNPTIDWAYIAGLTNYQYEYDDNPDFTSPFFFEITSASSQANLTSLSYGTTYYWRVRLVHAKDTSDWTDAWSFTTIYQMAVAPDLISPADADTGLSPNNINLICSDVSLATSYVFYYDTSALFTNPTSLVSTDTVEVTSVDYGTTYYWRARASNGSGYSPYSDTWSFTTKDTIMPASVIDSLDVPQLLFPANDSIGLDTALVLDWTIIANATAYEYQFGKDSLFADSVSTVTSAVYLSSLEFATTYFWRAKAKNDSLQSDWSYVWWFRTKDAPVDTASTGIDSLAAPTLLTPFNTSADQDTMLNLDWTDVTNATSYEYQLGTDSTFVDSTSVSLSTVNISGLNYTSNYYWRVKALNDTLQSLWSNIWWFTTKDAPVDTTSTGSDTLFSPQLISPVNAASDQDTSITLDWTDVVNATSYEFHYSTDSTFTTTTSGSVSGSTKNIFALDHATKYYWRARAVNDTAMLFSNWSEVWSFTTMEKAIVLSAPILILPADNSIGNDTSLTLVWNSVANTTSYEYQYDTDSTFSSSLSGATSGVIKNIVDLKFNKEYYWRVRAVEDTLLQLSEWSEIWSFETKSKPTGIDQLDKELLLKIYPNPAKDQFYIKASWQTNLRMFDVSGKLVLTKELTLGINELNIKRLNTGVYHISLSDQRYSIHKRFIKSY